MWCMPSRIICLSLSGQMLCMCPVCVFWGFFFVWGCFDLFGVFWWFFLRGRGLVLFCFGGCFFRGHFFVQSFISSLDAIARVVDDHELFIGAFLLMIVAVHKSPVARNKSYVALTEDSYFIFLYLPYFVLYCSPSLLWSIWGVVRQRESPTLWLWLCGVWGVRESTIASLQKK